jgi:hypothetical protein
MDFIKKRLNFDVSNLTDIKARKTIATTAFYTGVPKKKDESIAPLFIGGF